MEIFSLWVKTCEIINATCSFLWWSNATYQVILLDPLNSETSYQHEKPGNKGPIMINPLNPELNPICYLLALLGAQHFVHVSRIRVKLLTFRLLMSYMYGAPILDVSRSHTTAQHSR